MPSFSAYDPFAWIYNKYWGPRFCQRLLPTLEKLLLRQLPVKARVLELCCGTGHLVQALTARGFVVTALTPTVKADRRWRVFRVDWPASLPACTIARAQSGRVVSRL